MIPRSWMTSFLVVSGMSLALLAPLGLRSSTLRWNRTASVPTGLYRIVGFRPTRVPQYAALCLPESMLDMARETGASIPAGECPSGVEPLLKPIYRATRTNPIAFTERGFEVGGRLLKNTAPKPFSRKGKPLDHTRYGVYTTGLWAVSDWNPDSFDSRYFGPVPASSIRFHLVPFLLF
jgi:conjugative transfer signal peptidase TraF